MKLNKPPVSEEQTLLEDYVGFLLTDRSNVTPLHGRNKLAEASQAVKTLPESKGKMGQSQGSPSGTQDNRAESSTPNWTTIEKVTLKSDSKNIKPAPAPKVFEESKKPTENKYKPAEHSETAIERLAVEEAEAKAWDSLLTREKEQAWLASHESAKPSTENKVSERPQTNKVAEREVSPKPGLETQFEVKLPHTPVIEQDPRLARVEKLLAKLSLATQPEAKISPEVDVSAEISPREVSETKISAEAVEATFIPREPEKLRNVLPEVFQTLIFKVGPIPLAVPLLKLGGIVKISPQDISKLPGMPDWLLGLTPNDRGNLMVIDTRRYLMPEKPAPAGEKEYEYLILLDDSNWALACHSVGDAKNLTQNDIRWSEKSSARPWFAGMVVDYMSALIEVDELINLLAATIVD